MSERNYKQAFAAAAVICVVLAVALGYVLLRHGQVVATPEETSTIVAKGPDLADDHASTDFSPAFASHRSQDRQGRDADSQ